MENSNSPKEPIRSEEDNNVPAQDTIVISQTTIYYLLTAIMFFVAGLIVGWVGSQTTVNGTVNETRNMVATLSISIDNLPKNIAASVPQVAAQPTETAVPRQTIDLGDAPSWGPADAKVTVVEFSDFQCPYCGMFYQQTYPLLKKNYGDKIRFVFKNFPLSLHPDAMPAALAAECANEQGKFWEYHDVLFENQQNLNRDGFLKYASQVGVSDIPKFTQCYDSQKYKDKIQADMDAGVRYFVAGTPTFYFNGYYAAGARQYSDIQNIIEAVWCEADATHTGCNSVSQNVTLTPIVTPTAGK
jgi:protein-disulfide isomerase